MTDQLEWHERPDRPLTYTAYTQRGRYDIVDSSKGDPRNAPWYTRRMDHALMPSFDGLCPTLDAAKRACEVDFVALQRADRWLDYLRDNDPPFDRTVVIEGRA